MSLLSGRTRANDSPSRLTSNWSIKAEYLYADLGNMSYSTAPLISPFAGLVFSSANTTTTVHVHENIARVGINCSFGAWPLVAKY